VDGSCSYSVWPITRSWAGDRKEGDISALYIPAVAEPGGLTIGDGEDNPIPLVSPGHCLC